MPTLQIKVVATASLSVTKTLSQADLDRFSAAYKLIYGQVPAGPADPVTGIVPMRDMTNTEVFNAWCAGIYQGTVNNIKSQEQTTAAQTASTAVQTITLT